jgi:putative DNA primase/helicase
MHDKKDLAIHRYYISRGWRIIPVPLGQKSPIISGWQNLRIDESDLPKYFEGESNIGLLLGEVSGGLIDVDLDCEEALRLAPSYLPNTDLVHGRSSKPNSHWYYKVKSPLKYQKFTDSDSPDPKQSTIVEIRTGPGHQTIVPPSIHPSGEQLYWSRSGEPSLVDAKELEQAVAKLAACALIARHWPEQGTRQEAALALAGLLLGKEMPEDDVITFVRSAAHAAGDDEISKRISAVYSTAAKLQSGENVTGGPTLSQLLTGDGKKVIAKVCEWLELDNGSNSARYPLTDMGNAELLVYQHGHELHYCHTSGKWYTWDGARWKADDTGEIDRKAKETAKHLYVEASKQSNKAYLNHARQSQSYNRIKAMIKLAESDVRIAINNKSLDRNPWLFNGLNGTIDLHTGKLRAHDPTDLITKLAPVQFDPAAVCPTWLNFLDRIMARNEILIGYLQRAVGYALTGDTREQVLFLFYGTGANGKSTFINTILKMLGDYAKQAAPNLLNEKRVQSHPTEIADLEGCRFISSTDCEHRNGFAEALIKQLTGGERLKGRLMRQDFGECEATQKFFIAVNNKPSIKGTDDGIWRRIKTIPFTVTIPESERDKTLREKLLAEFPGILNWALQGCLEWQREGLGTPEEVTEATNEYRHDEDSLRDFLEECCATNENATEKCQRVYQAYSAWCEENGERPMSKNSLSKELKQRGFQSERGTGGYYYWVGLELKVPVSGEEVKFSEANRGL